MSEVQQDSKAHPTIYYVHLHEQSSISRWEAGSESYRDYYRAQWNEKARAAGKRSVEVWCRFGQLGAWNL